MNIILFGPPGAGKGTQADNLVKHFKLYKISTGDLLRKEIQKKSRLGHEIKSIIDKGNLASDDIINNLIEKILSNKEHLNKLIFDGYPRNLNQSVHLDTLIKKYNQEISCVFYLNVDEDILTKRILGRMTCTKCGLSFNEFFNPPNKENHKCASSFLKKRTDDNEQTIKKRFDTYSRQTLPVLEYYSKQEILHKVDGNRQIDQINEEIRGIIASLEAWLYILYLYK